MDWPRYNFVHYVNTTEDTMDHPMEAHRLYRTYQPNDRKDMIDIYKPDKYESKRHAALKQKHKTQSNRKFI